MTRDERLLRLEDHIVKLGTRLNFLAEQLAEQNLRVRFIMSAIQLTRPVPGGLISVDGTPQTEQTDLFVQYMTGGRDQMLDALDKENADVQAVMAQLKAEETADGEGTPLGPGAGAETGASAGAEHDIHHRAAEDPPHLERADRQPLRPDFAHGTVKEEARAR